MAEKERSSMSYVWCSREGCRIPAYRCLLCGERCYPEHHADAEANRTLELLVKSGKYKECYVVKRRGKAMADDSPNVLEIGEERKKKEGIKQFEGETENKVFLVEEGRLKPFELHDYTSSILYQVVESFSVECRLVRPEDPNTLIFEGKKPSKKTVPMIVAKDGDCELLDSWESLETRPEQLAHAAEVIGVAAVKQVFVLKRR